MSDRRVPPGGGFGIALVVGLFLWLNLFYACTLTAQDIDGTVPIPQGAVLPASTGCIGDSIVTVFREDVEANPFVKAQLESHEAVHRAQIAANMAEGLSCVEAFHALTASPLINLIAEVPAYRAQAEWMRNNATRVFDEPAFFKWVAEGLHAAYDGLVPLDYIHEWLTTGLRPGWPGNPDHIKPNWQAADSLLQKGGVS